MRSPRPIRPLLVALVLSAGVLLAAPASAPTAAQVRAALAKRFPSLKVDGLKPSALPGLWEFNVGLDVFYISADGRHLVRGDLVDLEQDRNLAEARRAELRRAQLAQVAAADLIVYSPPRPLHTVTVFTDIDCGYCRKLHSELDQYLKLGIRIQYLAYPRGGPGSVSWRKALDVWCATDRNVALTRAKRDQPVPRASCDGAAVMRGYQLGDLFRLEGTPLIITDSGDSIGGYLEAAELKRRLDSLAKKPQG